MCTSVSELLRPQVAKHYIEALLKPLSSLPLSTLGSLGISNHSPIVPRPPRCDSE